MSNMSLLILGARDGGWPSDLAPWFHWKAATYPYKSAQIMALMAAPAGDGLCATLITLKSMHACRGRSEEIFTKRFKMNMLLQRLGGLFVNS